MEKQCCAVCRGAGFLLKDGQPLLCPACQSLVQAQRLRRLSQLEGDLATKSLENFERRRGTAEALEAVHRALKRKHGFLTLWGGYGTGKTHLLAALVNRCLDDGVGAVYCTLPDALSALRQRVGWGDCELWLEQMASVQVLALDEMDKLRLTDWAGEALFRLIDKRYRFRDKLLHAVAEQNHNGANKPAQSDDAVSQVTGRFLL